MLESSLGVFQTRYDRQASVSSRPLVSSLFRCELNAADDDLTVKQRSTGKLSSNLKATASALKTSSPHQQLLAQLIRLEQQKKLTKPILASSSQSIADLLQTPMKSLSSELNDPFEQKTKRFKSSHRPGGQGDKERRTSLQTDKLTQLLSSPTSNGLATGTVHSLGTPSIFDRLTAGNVIPAASSPSQPGRRRSKGTLSTKQQRNLLSHDLLSTTDRTSDDVTSLKAQLLEVAKKLKQKEVRPTDSIGAECTFFLFVGFGKSVCDERGCRIEWTRKSR